MLQYCLMRPSMGARSAIQCIFLVMILFACVCLVQSKSDFSPTDPVSESSFVLFPSLSPFPRGGISPTITPAPDVVVGGSLSQEDNPAGFQYSILIDAGSTGSRLTIYHYQPREVLIALPTCRALNQFEALLATSDAPTTQHVSESCSFPALTATSQSGRPFSQPETTKSDSIHTKPGLHTILLNSMISSDTPTESSPAQPSLRQETTPRRKYFKNVTSSSSKSHDDNDDDVDSDDEVVFFDSTVSREKLVTTLFENLSPLIFFAYERFAAMNITNYIPYTPIYLTATGGVRSLLEDERSLLLQFTREFMASTGFYVEPSHIAVVSGEIEGLYGWISVNYLLSNFTLFTSNQISASSSSPSSSSSSLELDNQQVNTSKSEIQSVLDASPILSQLFPSIATSNITSGLSSSITSSISSHRPTVGTIDLGGATLQLALSEPSATASSSHTSHPSHSQHDLQVGNNLNYTPTSSSHSFLSSFPFSLGTYDTNLFIQCFWYYGKDTALWRIHNILYTLIFSQELVDEQQRYFSYQHHQGGQFNNGDDNDNDNDSTSGTTSTHQSDSPKHQKQKHTKHDHVEDTTIVSQSHRTRPYIAHRPVVHARIRLVDSPTLAANTIATSFGNASYLSEYNNLTHHLDQSSLLNTISHDDILPRVNNSNNDNQNNNNGSNIQNIITPSYHNGNQSQLNNISVLSTGLFDDSHDNSIHQQQAQKRYNSWMNRQLPHHWDLPFDPSHLRHNKRLSNPVTQPQASSTTPLQQDENSNNNHNIEDSMMSFHSPCMLRGYKAMFQPQSQPIVNDNVENSVPQVLILGHGNFSECYALARQLVISRTTAPCYNTDVKHEDDDDKFDLSRHHNQEQQQQPTSPPARSNDAEFDAQPVLVEQLQTEQPMQLVDDHTFPQLSTTTPTTTATTTASPPTPTTISPTSIVSPTVLESIMASDPTFSKKTAKTLQKWEKKHNADIQKLSSETGSATVITPESSPLGLQPDNGNTEPSFDHSKHAVEATTSTGGDVPDFNQTPYSGQCRSFFGQYRPFYDSSTQFYLFSGFARLGSWLNLTTTQTVIPMDTSSKSIHLDDISSSHSPLGYTYVTESFNLTFLERRGKEVCLMTLEELSNAYPNEQLYTLERLCWFFSYTIALLHDGMRFSMDGNNLHFADSINNVEVTYSIGAMVVLANAQPYRIRYQLIDSLSDFASSNTAIVAQDNTTNHDSISDGNIVSNNQEQDDTAHHLIEQTSEQQQQQQQQEQQLAMAPMSIAPSPSHDDEKTAWIHIIVHIVCFTIISLLLWRVISQQRKIASYERLRLQRQSTGHIRSPLLQNYQALM